MKRLVVLTTLLIGITVASYAQRVALIDMEYILSNIPAYVQGEKELEQRAQQWQTVIEKKAKEAQQMYASYQKEASRLSDQQRAQREQAIVEKEKEMNELRRNYFGPEGELAKFRSGYMEPLQDRIYEAVKSLSEQNGLDMVIDRASAMSIIYATPALDISNDVLSKLGFSN